MTLALYARRKQWPLDGVTVRLAHSRIHAADCADCETKDGKLEEKVHDFVWGNADRRKPGADGKLPPLGNTVDVPNATWSNTVGDPELITVWRDPEFNPAERAFYYARVLEIPTPRWTAYDAKYFGVKMPPEVPMTSQERAYTSPIWYTPG